MQVSVGVVKQPVSVGVVKQPGHTVNTISASQCWGCKAARPYSVQVSVGVVKQPGHTVNKSVQVSVGVVKQPGHTVNTISASQCWGCKAARPYSKHNQCKSVLGL